MNSKERRVYEYNMDGKFLFTLGYIQNRTAHSPLEEHNHGKMREFVIPEKGRQHYCIGQEVFAVNPGEIFCTNPGEVHSSGNLPEEKASFFYMILDLERAVQNGMGCVKSDEADMKLFWSKQTGHLRTAAPNLIPALKKLLAVMETQCAYRETRIRNLLSEVLICLCEASTEEKMSKNYSMKKSLQYIQEHIQEKISVQELASLENMSLSAFKNHFSEKVEMSPAEYILRIKIERIKEELVNSQSSVTEIAYRYGFSSSQYFATAFKRFCYVTPSEYRRKHQ